MQLQLITNLGTQSIAPGFQQLFYSSTVGTVLLARPFDGCILPEKTMLTRSLFVLLSVESNQEFASAWAGSSCPVDV